MVQMITVVDGTQHNITIRDVMYAFDLMHNLIFIANARKNWFMVRVDDGFSKATRGNMDLHNKLLGKVMICGFETRVGLYETVSGVC